MLFLFIKNAYIYIFARENTAAQINKVGESHHVPYSHHVWRLEICQQTFVAVAWRESGWAGRLMNTRHTVVNGTGTILFRVGICVPLN